MPATAVEQMILELINRARLDPAGEAARDGIDLNEGLAAGTITATSKQPLAMNETLLTIARAHDSDMIANNYFGHTDSSGHSPDQRMTAAGYSYSWWGENIAWSGTTGTVTQQMSVALETQLFVDSGVSGRGHRVNLLNNVYQEVGAGVENGSFMGYNGTLLTQDFAQPSSGGQFLTGVSYVDTDGDNFYSIGEGRGGVSVAVAGGGSTSTASAGGYSLSIGAGVQNVTFSGGGLAAPVSVAVTVLAGTNAKVDMVGQGTIDTSASLTDISGATRIIGLGTIGLTLTGDSSSETFSGTKGNDTFIGGGGFDTVIFTGAKSAYTITNLGGGSLKVSGGADGTDTLTGIDRLVFADQTVNLTSPPANDFNGDGKSDIFWRKNDGSDALWTSNSSGGFTGVGLGGVDTSWQVAGTGDFNGDGEADVLWRNSSGADVIWNSNGAGGFNGATIGSADSTWQVAGVGDFNGDGKADILWRKSDGTDALWESNSTGGFTGIGLGSVDSSWQVAGVGDFNGDGKADILWRKSDGSDALWDSNSSGGFTGVGLGGVDTNWQVAGVGDFNGDGEADVLWRKNDGSDVLWTSNGSGGFNGAGIGSADTSWQVAGVGDFNGDGKADILWNNTTSGDTTLWDSNSSGGFTGVYVGNAPTSWKIQA